MIYKTIAKIAHKNPERVAVIQRQKEFTYNELQNGLSRLATFLLKKGIEAGDRVGIIVENSPEYIVSYFGVQKAGGISVSINPQCSAYEFGKIFGNCLPKILIVEKKQIKNAVEAITDAGPVKTVIVTNADTSEELSLLFKKAGKNISNVGFYSLRQILKSENNFSNYPLIDKKNTASIIYTSGTTGDPKGVMLSHNNFSANADSIIKYLQLTKNDRIMAVLPFCYSYGTSLLTTHFMVGASLVLENSFMYPNVILDKMLEYGVTGFAGVPSTFAILLNRSNIRNYRFPSLRYITQAGGAMPPKHAKEISKILTNTDIYIMYGQTEATARLTYLDPKDFVRKPGSIGKAIPGVKIELIADSGMPAEDGEEGEIVAQGGNIMTGYWEKPEETKKVLRDGRLYTGDIAVRDSEGYLTIVSRRSDMIKSGAHRISPKEIEEIILDMPEVHEVSVVGIEDEILGMAIKAVIVLKDGLKLDTKDVQKYCHQKLAAYKLPKEVVFVDELPKTVSGKVRKHMLKRSQTENERSMRQ